MYLDITRRTFPARSSRVHDCLIRGGATTTYCQKTDESEYAYCHCEGLVSNPLFVNRPAAICFPALPGGLPNQLGRTRRSVVDTAESTSRNVRIQVRSQYIPGRSAPSLHQWFFAYRISIANESKETIQLLSRHWIITDARGHEQEVEGEGVVGEQPVLAPGESFEYTSGCPLTTPFGSMRGKYQMLNRDGEQFDVAIPAFILRVPGSMN